MIDGDQFSLQRQSYAQRVSPGIYEHSLVFTLFVIENEGNYSCSSNISVNADGFQLQVSGANEAFFDIALESK